MPASERAILDTRGAVVHSINGERPKSCLTAKFELPPGAYRVVLSLASLYEFGRGCIDSEPAGHVKVLDFEARPGHRYFLDIVPGWRFDRNTFSASVVDQEDYDARRPLTSN